MGSATDIVRIEDFPGLQMEARIRILAIDDHPALREGLAALLGNQEDMLLIAESGTGQEGLLLFQQHRPDVTLLDLQLPDLHGIEVLQRIRAFKPAARVIVLTTFLGDAQATQAIRAGAAGYLLKTTLRCDLLETIRAVHEGHFRIPDSVASELAQHVTHVALTPREVEVLRLIAAGNANKMVAGKLSLSEDTVKGHVRNILSKLGAKDRTQAVTIGLRRGIFDL